MGDVQYDPEQRTLIYILWIENVQFISSEQPQTEVVCRWYVDEANHCSHPFTLGPGADPVRAAYCSFLVLSFEDIQNCSRSVTLTLSHSNEGEHIAVAYLDLANFSTEESFKIQVVELISAEGTVAQAELHTALQPRWSLEPVVANLTPQFMDPSTDAQSHHLYSHLAGEPAPAADAQADAAAAYAHDEAAEAQRAMEAEAAARQAEEERARQAELELTRQAEAEKARQAEAEARERELQRQKEQDEEDRKRRLAEEEHLRQLREEEERERRREEEERERRRQKEREEMERERERKEEEMRLEAQAQRERRLWEEERDRLRQDARRERQREAAERERRTSERRRQADLIAAKLTADSQAARMTRGAARVEEDELANRSFMEPSFMDAHNQDAALRTSRSERSRRTGAADMPEQFAQDARWESGSGTDHRQPSGPALWGRSSAGRRQGPSANAKRSQSSRGRQASSSSRNACSRAYSGEAAHGRGPGSHIAPRSATLPPKRRTEVSAFCDGPLVSDAGVQAGNAHLGTQGMDGVLASALADVASRGEVQVAAAEECALRLLLLQKQLSSSKEPRTAALADAASSVVPHLLQVLEAAHTVCDTSRERSSPAALMNGQQYYSDYNHVPAICNVAPSLQWQAPPQEPVMQQAICCTPTVEQFSYRGQLPTHYEAIASPQRRSPALGTPLRESLPLEDAPLNSARRGSLLDPGSAGPQERIMRAASPSRRPWGALEQESGHVGSRWMQSSSPGESRASFTPRPSSASRAPTDLLHHNGHRSGIQRAVPDWNGLSASIMPPPLNSNMPLGWPGSIAEAPWSAMEDPYHQPASSSRGRRSLPERVATNGHCHRLPTQGVPLVPPLQLGNMGASRPSEDLWAALAFGIAPQPSSGRGDSPLQQPWEAQREALHPSGAKSFGRSRAQAVPSRPAQHRDWNDLEEVFESSSGTPVPQSSIRGGALRSGRNSARGPTEDRYLKILQALQAKTGAGTGLAQQLLAAASKRKAAS